MNIQDVIFELDMPLITTTSITYQDQTNNAATTQFYYQIETRDLCGDVYLSPVIGNFPITGQLLPGRQNSIMWQDFFLEGAEVQSYDIVQTQGGSVMNIGTVEPAVTEFVDIIDGPSAGNTIFCYRVFATTDVVCQDLEFTSIHSSPVICVEQNSSILVPNALVIGGINNLFKPVILYPESIDSYQIRIFDRYGGVVFESSNPQQGWDGSKNGKALAFGVYHFYIRAIQTNGRVIEETGPITLIR